MNYYQILNNLKNFFYFSQIANALKNGYFLKKKMGLNILLCPLGYLQIMIISLYVKYMLPFSNSVFYFFMNIFYTQIEFISQNMKTIKY